MSIDCGCRDAAYACQYACREHVWRRVRQWVRGFFVLLECKLLAIVHLTPSLFKRCETVTKLIRRKKKKNEQDR